MAIRFQQIKDLQGAVRVDAIDYTDENGQVWWVPQGHRVWNEVYVPWLAAGNQPLPAP